MGRRWGFATSNPDRWSGAPITPTSTSKPPPVELYRLRAAPYVETWEWQRRRARAVASGEALEALLLVEHPPVFTLGRRSDPAHLLTGEAELRARGAEVHWIDRGGDATWHGSGQLTGYPILDLSRRGRDLHVYVDALEHLLIDVAASYGITAARWSGRPGIWVGEEKLAAIGVKITHGWVSYHGFALNVAPDLSWFAHIVPCGLHDAGVTSLARLLGGEPDVEEVAGRLADRFAKRFEARLTKMKTQLGDAEPSPPQANDRRSGMVRVPGLAAAGARE